MENINTTSSPPNRFADSAELYFRWKEPASTVAEEIARAVIEAAGDHVVVLRGPDDLGVSWVVIRRPQGVVYIPAMEKYDSDVGAACAAMDAGDDSVKFPESAWECMFCGDKDIVEERVWRADDEHDGFSYGVCDYHKDDDSPAHMARVLDLLAAEAAAEAAGATGVAGCVHCAYFARVNARWKREETAKAAAGAVSGTGQ